MHDRIGQPGDITHSSVASRAANIRPDMRKVRRFDVFHRAYRKYLLVGLGIGFGLLTGAGLLITYGHLKFGMLVVVVGLAIVLFAWRFRQMLTGDAYRNGLLVPGVITSVAPLRVAVAAEVENGSGENPRGIVWGIKQLEIPALTVHPEQVGERVPCVALFGGDHDGVYANFEPRPLAWGTDDPTILEAARQAIDSDEWAITEHLAAQVTHLTNNDAIAYFDEDLKLVPPASTASPA